MRKAILKDSAGKEIARLIEHEGWTVKHPDLVTAMDRIAPYPDPEMPTKTPDALQYSADRAALALQATVELSAAPEYDDKIDY